MKRVVYLGGGHGDVPLISAMLELGYYVISVSLRREDPGHLISNTSEFVDFSDINGVAALIEKYNPDFIFAGCNDFAAIVASILSDKYLLPGHDSKEKSFTIHHKDRFRDCVSKLNLPSPKSIIVGKEQKVSAISADFSFPVMVKPIDLTGGKGVTKLDKPADLESALRNAFAATRQDHIVIEEFVEGSHHSISAILIDQNIEFHFAADEYFFLNPYLVAGACTSEDQSSNHALEALRQIMILAQNLKLKDGLVHAQYIQSPKFGVVLLDVCRRPPGDYFVELVTHATGIDYSEAIVKSIFTLDRLDKEYLKQSSHVKAVIRHCAMARQNGKFTCLKVHPEFKAFVTSNRKIIKIGETLTDYKNQKTNILFAEFENFSQLNDAVNNLDNYIKIETEE